MEVVRKVIVDNHLRGSRGSHDRVKKDGSVVGVKRMSQSKINREITKLKERLSIVTELLHEEDIEDQYYGWKLKRKV